MASCMGAQALDGIAKMMDGGHHAASQRVAFCSTCVGRVQWCMLVEGQPLKLSKGRLLHNLPRDSASGRLSPGPPTARFEGIVKR